MMVSTDPSFEHEDLKKAEILPVPSLLIRATGPVTRTSDLVRPRNRPPFVDKRGI